MINITKVVMGDEEKQAVLRVMDSGMLARGPETEAFEREFAEYLGTEHALMVSSGTAALIASLHALGVKQGDKVATTALTFVATGNSILALGADPVFVDINPDTMNMDLDALKAVCSQNAIKAIIPVHLYGLACAMPQICDIAASFNIRVLEDCSQAHGAAINDKKVGTFGDIAAFSLYATKNLGVGEGGMIVTDDDELLQRCSDYCNYGRRGRYTYANVGYNYKPTEIAAAIGRAKLRKLDKHNNRRIQIANRYRKHLTPWFKLQEVPDGYDHVYYVFTIRTDDRDELMDYLHQQDINAMIYFPDTVYKTEAYQDIRRNWYECKEAERAVKSILSIPMHPFLVQAELEKVEDALRTWARHTRRDRHIPAPDLQSGYRKQNIDYFSDRAKSNPHKVVVSHPRSGRNWFQAVVHNLTGTKTKAICNMEPSDYNKGFPFVVTHRCVWREADTEIGKYVMILRDPRDAFLSRAYKDAYIFYGYGDPVSHDVVVDKYWRNEEWRRLNINEWRDHLGIVAVQNHLIIQYERLCLYPELEFGRALDFLGIATDRDIASVVWNVETVRPDKHLPDKSVSADLDNGLQSYRTHCLQWQADPMFSDQDNEDIWAELGDLMIQWGYTKAGHSEELLDASLLHTSA